MSADIGTEQLIIGHLMREPSLLLQQDKYQINTDDFSSAAYQYIYYAIHKIVQRGETKSISVIDIENFFGEGTSSRHLYDEVSGRGALTDAVQKARDLESSFESAYVDFKRYNLIKDIKKAKFLDSRPIDSDRESNPGIGPTEEIAIQDYLEGKSAEEVLIDYEMELMDLKAKYSQGDASESQTIFEGLEELMEGLQEYPEVGIPFQGELFNHIVGGALPRRLYLRSGSSGLGKALPDSVKIPSPSGWKLVGEVKKGDYLFDAFGRPTKVLEVFPQEEQEVWEVIFKDGRAAKCSPDHLWSFNTAGQKKPSREGRRFFTETTEQIRKRELQRKDQALTVLVPMHYAVEYPEKEFYLKPYSMGLLLGDGSFRQQESNKSLQYSSEDRELPEHIAEEMGWRLKKASENNHAWYFDNGKAQENQYDKINIWVGDALREHPELMNTYSHSKFIPRKYLEGSVSQRLDLINGLLDSDGSVDKKGRVSFFTNGEQLRDDFIELAQSLGFKTHTIIDSRPGRNDNYIITITGRPEDKNKLFRLSRKRKLMEEWYSNGKRKEANTHNPIIEIRELGYKEKMTCFLVDNEEHLFLTENFVVTHNTRQAFADAAMMAFPIRYCHDKREWVKEGYSEKVLFILTEQEFDEIQKMAVAYLTGVNESVYKRGLASEEQMKLMRQGLKVFQHFQHNLYLARVPNPSTAVVQQIIREHVIRHDIRYVYYDYIFESPSLFNEFKGMNLRTDQMLFNFSDTLKKLAVELDIFIMSGTQVNAKSDSTKDIRNEAALAGARAVINKADVGCIMARPTTEELTAVRDLCVTGQEPNVVTDIYKVRGGEHTQVRVWSHVDLGTLRKKDLFVTDSNLQSVNINYQHMSFYQSDEDLEEIENFRKELNNGVCN